MVDFDLLRQEVLRQEADFQDALHASHHVRETFVVTLVEKVQPCLRLIGNRPELSPDVYAEHRYIPTKSRYCDSRFGDQCLIREDGTFWKIRYQENGAVLEEATARDVCIQGNVLEFVAILAYLMESQIQGKKNIQTQKMHLLTEKMRGILALLR